MPKIEGSLNYGKIRRLNQNRPLAFNKDVKFLLVQASINSFDPKSIRTLVSVFNPFLMGGLLLLKVLIPFLVVACFVCAVRQVSQMPSR